MLVVRCSLFVVCRLLFVVAVGVVCCLLFDVFVVRCLLFVVCCLLRLLLQWLLCVVC